VMWRTNEQVSHICSAGHELAPPWQDVDPKHAQTVIRRLSYFLVGPNALVVVFYRYQDRSKFHQFNPTTPKMTINYVWPETDVNITHLPLSDPLCANDTCLAFAEAGDASQTLISWTSQFSYGWYTLYYWVRAFDMISI
jgi:hypothetical protein